MEFGVVIMEVMGPGSPIAMIVVNRLGPVHSEPALGAARDADLANA
ncbi:MAG: hypothetical protein R6U99_11845 [Nioella sp.]